MATIATDVFGHKSMLFSFLGEKSWSPAQRMIGTAMILQTDAGRGFRASRIDWKKITYLSGHPVRQCEEAFAQFIAAGWLEGFTNSYGIPGYRVTKARVAAAIANRDAHRSRVRRGKVEAPPEKPSSPQPVEQQDPSATKRRPTLTLPAFRKCA